MTTPRIVERLAARDRQLLERVMLTPETRRITRAAWFVATHAGGAVATLSAALLPLWFDGLLTEGARRSTALLVASHLLVQLVKRSVGRPRPELGIESAIRAPDRFSFPSGHAAASLSLALGYASVYPAWGAPLVLLAGLVGASRVVLGVHFPADVIAGQMIAFLTAIACAPIL